MHYFVYKADRHHLNYRYPQLSKTTIRGDFNLDIMRTGLKGRYTIHGYMTHPFHIVLKSIGMQDLLHGHIIEVPDSRHAIWLKLNYDQIGKEKTRYQGSYKDIKAEDLQPLANRFIELQKQISVIQSDVYSVNSFLNTIDIFLNKMSKLEVPLIDEATRVSCVSLKEKMAAESYRVDQDVRSLKKQAEQVAQEVKDYLSAHQM